MVLAYREIDTLGSYGDGVVECGGYIFGCGDVGGMEVRLLLMIVAASDRSCCFGVGRWETSGCFCGCWSMWMSCSRVCWRESVCLMVYKGLSGCKWNM